MSKLSTRNLALGALFSAMSFISLFLAGYIPGIEMTLYALASAFPALMIIECAGKEEASAAPGILVYVVTVLLGIFIIPNKLAVIPYAFFFGIYGVIKYYIEKFNHVVMRTGLKLVTFAGIFSAAYLCLREVCFATITLPQMSFPLLLLLAVAILMLYDYLFSLGIAYYIQRIHGGKIR